MADKAILEEFSVYPKGQLPIPPLPHVVQVKDIGSSFDAINAKTKYVRIRAKGSGFWWANNTGATANTANNGWIEPGEFVDYEAGAGSTIDTAADA